MAESLTQKFHFSRTIDLGHILTTFSIIGSMLYWGSTVETRLAVQSSSLVGHKQQIVELKQDQTRQDQEHKEMRGEIGVKLDKLGDKIDRLVERTAYTQALERSHGNR